MPMYDLALPEFPCRTDMWDELAKETRPILIYGMGNGADKLIDRLEHLGIKYADIFASDGFVRGHSFHGIRVKSFSEVREIYPDFVIVLSFASNRYEVLDMLAGIDEKYDMYVPDMPVAGVDEFFDKDFYNSHYGEIVSAYECLSDEESRNTFAAVIKYKLSGRMKFLKDAYCTRDEMYSLFPADKIFCAVDAGAYNGDTVREAKCYFKKLKKVYAIEPDSKNFRKLVKYSEAETEIALVALNSAAWSHSGEGEFSVSGNRNSSISSTASFEHARRTVSLVAIDNFASERIDYIKYDVEGAEREALLGSHSVIEKYRPSLLVSVYHKSRDIFELTNMLRSKYSGYAFYLRKLRCLPAWEVNLIMIPNSDISSKGNTNEAT